MRIRSFFTWTYINWDLSILKVTKTVEVAQSHWLKFYHTCNYFYMWRLENIIWFAWRRNFSDRTSANASNQYQLHIPLWSTTEITLQCIASCIISSLVWKLGHKLELGGSAQEKEKQHFQLLFLLNNNGNASFRCRILKHSLLP